MIAACPLNLYMFFSQAQFDMNNFSLPTHFSRRVQTCIDNGTLAEPDNRAAFIREIVAFFEGILPSPTPAQYHAISKKVADQYPCLKDAKHTNYWVSYM